MRLLCPSCREHVEILGCASPYALVSVTPDSTTTVAVCSFACKDKLEAEAKARKYRRVAF